MTGHDGEADLAPAQATGRGGNALLRLWPLAAMAAVTTFVLAMGWHRALSLETLLLHRAALNDFLAAHRAAAAALFAAIYAGSVALSLPGATLLTVTGGLLFGAATGGVLSALAAIAGATAVFLIARSAFGDRLIRRAGPRLERIAQGFRRDAFHYLLFLRLVPLFPFWLVNLAPAILGVKLATFLAATAIGILPATFALSLFGAGLQSAVDAQEEVHRACIAAGRADCRLDFDAKAALTPELIAALAILGVLALIPVAVRRLRARSSSA